MKTIRVDRTRYARHDIIPALNATLKPSTDSASAHVRQKRLLLRITSMPFMGRSRNTRRIDAPFKERRRTLQRKTACPSKKGGVPFKERRRALQRKTACPSKKDGVPFEEGRRALVRATTCPSKARQIFDKCMLSPKTMDNIHTVFWVDSNPWKASVHEKNHAHH